MRTSPVDKKIMFNLLLFLLLQDELRQASNDTSFNKKWPAWDTWDRTLTLIVLRTFSVIGCPGCWSVAKSSYLFIYLFIFHQYYSLLEHFSSLTTAASWCFPSKGKNSLKHTSNPLELTFSNHKYIASFGLVLRVYLTETNTRGLEAKLCKKC